MFPIKPYTLFSWASLASPLEPSFPALASKFGNPANKPEVNAAVDAFVSRLVLSVASELTEPEY